MHKTVTPCAVTSTTTKTVTAAPSTATITLTDVENFSQTITSIETLTSVTTIEETATIVEPTEVIITETILDKKRAAAASTTSSPPAGTCAATTGSHTNVPTYASACSGTVRYSSACSCAGVTGSTTTLTASTVVSTTTSTITPLITATAIATEILVSSVTQIATTTVPVVFQTTDATLIIPSAYTSTAVVAPSAPTCLNFVATSGDQAGNFIISYDNSQIGKPAYSFVQFDQDQNVARPYNLRDDGTVYTLQGWGWVTRPGQPIDPVLETTDSSFSYYNENNNALGYGTFDHLICSIGKDNSGYPGAIGKLSCTFEGTPIFLVSCQDGTGTLYQSLEAESDDGAYCRDAGLVAVPGIYCY